MGNDELVKEGQFRIRVRKGDWEVDVSALDKDFVLEESDRLIKQFSTSSLQSTEAQTVEGKVADQNGVSQTRNLKSETVTEFYRQFKPQTNLDRILILGYWCEIKNSQPFFTVEDIQNKYREIRELVPANLRRDLATLQGRGFVQTAGKTEGAAYSLTNSGIREVESKLSKA